MNKESLFVFISFDGVYYQISTQITFQIVTLWRSDLLYVGNIVNILSARMEIRWCPGLKGRIPTHLHNKFGT